VEIKHVKESSKNEKVKWNSFLKEIRSTCIAPNEYERTLTKQKLHANSNKKLKKDF
jgi:hypothetical protein